MAVDSDPGHCENALSFGLRLCTWAGKHTYSVRLPVTATHLCHCSAESAAGRAVLERGTRVPGECHAQKLL